MALVIQKFGGTSVGNTDFRKNIASRAISSLRFWALH
jgi:aspartokinase